MVFGCREAAVKAVWERWGRIRGMDFPGRGGLNLSFFEFREENGGRGWDRTSDPYDVNVVLSR